MIATSSPALIVLSFQTVSTLLSTAVEDRPSISTYSRLIVSAELSRTFILIPGYFVSRTSKRSVILMGASKNSDCLCVKDEAEAKYSSVNWPRNGLVVVMMGVHWWIYALIRQLFRMHRHQKLHMIP